MLTNPAYRQRGADSTILSEPELIRVLAEPPPLDLIDRQSSRFTEPTSSDPLVTQRVDRSSCKLLNWRPRRDLNPRRRRESTRAGRKLLKLRNTDGYLKRFQ